MRDPLEHIIDLEGQVARLEHALDRERDNSAARKADARKWEAQAKRTRSELLIEIGQQLIREGKKK